MHSFLLLGLLPTAIAAQGLVAGVGRLNSGDQQTVQFNQAVLTESVSDIVDSINHGPNRTSSVALPVSKLYGVNVSGCYAPPR